MTTVGLGDLVPHTNIGADILIVWTVLGLGLLAIVFHNFGEAASRAILYVPFFSLTGYRRAEAARQKNKAKFSRGRIKMKIDVDGKVKTANGAKVTPEGDDDMQLENVEAG